MLNYAKLSKAVKQRVVVMVAKGFLLSEIARVLHDEHGLDVSIARLQRYDPRTATGSALSPELKALFYSTHAKAIEELQNVTLSHRAPRVALLQRLVDDALGRGDDLAVARYLRLIQADMAGLAWLNGDDDEQ